MAGKRKRDADSGGSRSGSAAAIEDEADDAVETGADGEAPADTEPVAASDADTEAPEAPPDDALETEAIDDEEIDSSASSSQVPMRVQERLPQRLVILPLDDMVFFPGMMLPILGQSDRSRATIQAALDGSKFLGLVAKYEDESDESDGAKERTRAARTSGKDGRRGSGSSSDSGSDSESRRETVRVPETGPDGLYTTGTLGRIVQKVGTGGETGVIVAGIRRVRIRKWIRRGPVLLAEVDYPDDDPGDAKELEAFERVVRRAVEELISLRPDIPDELGEAIENQQGPGRLADFLGGHMGLSVPERQGLLETRSIRDRLTRLLTFFERELDLARIGKRVRSDIRDKVEKQQRDFYLREQLKAIREELGEEIDEKEIEAETYEEKIAAAEMPPEIEERARYELKRLSVLPQEAAEYHVIRTYLDWMVDLPWSKSSEDSLDIKRAARILDEDHYGLEEVKERIVEFLAVRKLAPDRQGAILCLVGPPGVGKTSLGKSIARAMERKFFRASLGGMRDEAEIKGHRRTYIGAMPGKIIQGLRRVETNNPVFMLDEIDKLGSDWRGDPSSAMLEVLDPAQNDKFEDYYLDVPFDLSKVMFIATANYAGQIPAPLMDRMEVIEIPGYILAEKRAIATRYLLPRQLEAHGLEPKDLKLPYATIRAIAEGYTRESGVRDLERRIAQICRKVAAKRATGEIGPRKTVTVAVDELVDWLGRAKFDRDGDLRTRNPGVVTGLAWTPYGGEVLYVEARAMPGKGGFHVTGQVGKVMSESVRIALSIVRGDHERFGIDPRVFETTDVHIHVPAGAVPKDGPSAGITMTTALISLLCRGGKGMRVSKKIAMTGEITLSGTVLPVGGIREKVVAAKRAGIKTLVLPKANEPDLDDVPHRVRKGLTFVFAETIDDVLAVALPKLAPEGPARDRPTKTRPKRTRPKRA